MDFYVWSFVNHNKAIYYIEMSVFPFYWSKCNYNMLNSVGLKQAENKWIIPLTAMGVLAPGSAHSRSSAQPPIDMSRNFPQFLF